MGAVKKLRSMVQLGPDHASFYDGEMYCASVGDWHTKFARLRALECWLAEDRADALHLAKVLEGPLQRIPALRIAGFAIVDLNLIEEWPIEDKMVFKGHLPVLQTQSTSIWHRVR